ncbi:MAG: hypothetical protein V9E85_12155 [Candidatus Nanopelagicales bacterium]
MRKNFLSKKVVAAAPTGERFDLEAPGAVVDDNPPIVVVRDDLSVSSKVDAATGPPSGFSQYPDDALRWQPRGRADGSRRQLVAASAAHVWVAMG